MKLDFAEISINDKAIFDRYLKQYNPQVSELTFSNLFMWRNFYRLRYAQAEDVLYVISVPEKGEPFAFMPIGAGDGDGLEKALEELMNYFRCKGWELRLKRVPEEELGRFTGLEKYKMEYDLDRDNSDYLYLAEDLYRLSGKKFDGKRNHINKFKKQHEFEYVPLSPQYLEECLRIMDEWCAERDCDEHRGLYCEKLANTELLNNMEALGYKGALIKVDGRFEAFTAGEMLNGDTAVIHIEKATGKIQGLYTLINQQFCEKEWKEAKYINREQDLGLEGLRKAKLSYNPVKLVNKYTISIT